MKLATQDPYVLMEIDKIVPVVGHKNNTPFESLAARPLRLPVDHIENLHRPVRRTRRQPLSIVV